LRFSIRNKGQIHGPISFLALGSSLYLVAGDQEVTFEGNRPLARIIFQVEHQAVSLGVLQFLLEILQQLGALFILGDNRTGNHQGQKHNKPSHWITFLSP
jgi:hypothetical protein